MKTARKKKTSKKKPSASAADENRHWKQGKSGIHSNGLFAVRDIEKGTRVIEYIGRRLTKAQGYKRAIDWMEKAAGTGKGAVYIFELNRTTDIDGNVPWNPARLINHSCKPNCEPHVIRGHIWITARRNIPEGEELLYDYGYDLDHWEEHPCRCGAPNCIGYIVGAEHRGKLRRILAARTAKPKAKAKKKGAKSPPKRKAK